MRLCVAVLVLINVVFAYEQVNLSHTVHGYIGSYGIPRAEQIFNAEEKLKQSKIVGGLPAVAGQYPSQAGLIGDIIGTQSRTVCGASLISTTRVLTAAHCWNDGVVQVWRFTIVLGSSLLFSGGTRIVSSVVAVHPNYSSILARNDIAVIYLENAVQTSNLIAPIALPSGLELYNDFSGNSAIAVGYGLTSDNGQITIDQSLNHVRLNVITNSACSYAFPLIIEYSHLCTSGLGGLGACSGDSGGPLILESNNRNILIGVSSFVSGLGCQSNLPSAFTRVTAFIDFIESHL